MVQWKTFWIACASVVAIGGILHLLGVSPLRWDYTGFYMLGSVMALLVFVRKP